MFLLLLVLCITKKERRINLNLFISLMYVLLLLCSVFCVMQCVVVMAIGLLLACSVRLFHGPSQLANTEKRYFFRSFVLRTEFLCTTHNDNTFITIGCCIIIIVTLRHFLVDFYSPSTTTNLCHSITVYYPHQKESSEQKHVLQ